MHHGSASLDWNCVHWLSVLRVCDGEDTVSELSLDFVLSDFLRDGPRAGVLLERGALAHVVDVLFALMTSLEPSVNQPADMNRSARDLRWRGR